MCCRVNTLERFCEFCISRIDNATQTAYYSPATRATPLTRRNTMAKKTPPPTESGPWKIGKCYLIRTVTMIDTGRLVEVTEQELVLEDAAWIADTGRFADALQKE